MPKNDRVAQTNRIAGVPLPDQDEAYEGKVEAMINAGRWVVRCPDDTQGSHFAEVEFGQERFICPGCYPDSKAITFKLREDGKFDPVQDVEKRIAEAGKASKDGKEYAVIFPGNASEILALLRQRPAFAMNWLPGESEAFLTEENIAHSVGDIQPDITVVEGQVD